MDTNVKGVWYWNGDSSKNSQQDLWIQYEEDVSNKIEKVRNNTILFSSF